MQKSAGIAEISTSHFTFLRSLCTSLLTHDRRVNFIMILQLIKLPILTAAGATEMPAGAGLKHPEHNSVTLSRERFHTMG